MSALSSSSFAGTPLVASRPTTAGRVQAAPAQARFFKDKKAEETVKRGYNSQVRKAGRLLPKKGEEYVKNKPAGGNKLYSARTNRREGGFGGGGAYQKPIAGNPLSDIDPIIYVAGLLTVFIGIVFTLTQTA